MLFNVGVVDDSPCHFVILILLPKLSPQFNLMFGSANPSFIDLNVFVNFFLLAQVNFTEQELTEYVPPFFSRN